ncbi:MAG: OmpA family protein [Xanthomonadales bacterium]|nr:OmpA family protein [Xanthomonadales bacterium]
MERQPRLSFPFLSSPSLGSPLLALMLCGTLALPACTTLDPYTREEKTAHATRGALIGAGVGAAIGAITGGKRLKRAAIGAGVGALAGGAVGYYMDQQELALRQRLEGSGVSVTRAGENIILNMPGNVTFNTGSAAINGNFFDVLDSVAIVLEEYDQTVVIADGHTDSTGSEAFNQRLSEQRSSAVVGYLVNQGIPPIRTASYGYGESHPIADNNSASGRAANRRVELTLMPVTR